MLQPELPSSPVMPLLLFAFAWAVSLGAVIAGACMAWWLTHALGCDTLMALGAALACLAPPVVFACATTVCRQPGLGSVKIVVAIGTAVVVVLRALIVFCFLLLSFAPHPASPSLADLAGSVSQDVASSRRGSVVNSDKDGSRGLKAQREITKNTPTPELLPAVPAASQWPVETLAAVFLVKPAVIHLAFSVVLTMALESMAVLGPTLAMVAWGSRARPGGTEAEAVATVTAQAMMMLSLAAILPIAARRGARRNAMQNKRPRPEPAAAAEASVHRRARRRKTADEITRHLRDLLRRGLQGEVEGIAVQGDDVLLSTNRRLGALLGCGPGVVNGCLHRLQASGEIALAASSRATTIRMRPSPARDPAAPA